jgi:hypothetical protein
MIGLGTAPSPRDDDELGTESGGLAVAAEDPPPFTFDRTAALTVFGAVAAGDVNTAVMVGFRGVELPQVGEEPAVAGLFFNSARAPSRRVEGVADTTEAKPPGAIVLDDALES